ncbi:MAG: SAM-dependent methyltransferase, partial [Rhodospirillaceae bacterium]|nr:SAM-dependent methyltransferase [Rhodospirillaceae bacterium]
MSFGDMPIANGFLMPDQFNDEYSYELAPAFCSNCGAFQLIEQPRPEQMFHDNYAFFAGTSQVMMDHFQELADIARDRYLDG